MSSNPQIPIVQIGVGADRNYSLMFTQLNKLTAKVAHQEKEIRTNSILIIVAFLLILTLQLFHWYERQKI